MLYLNSIIMLSACLGQTVPLQTEARWFSTQSRSQILRPISQWVEDEIVLPNGPFSGERYRHARHPVSKLWFDEIDSGRWTRFAVTGPSQNGKTFMGYVAPVLYHLFEAGETVIIGIPDMGMANDKWKQDFLPVINSSSFGKLLPDRGEGSRGGDVKHSISFANGATLRFMSGGGRDKKRAGYTSRIVAITETDGMDEAGESSREADKIEQIEARTRAYGRLGKRVYLECTVSIELGRIWQEIKRGTDSKIVRPCPHCGVYVSPERENLVGWEKAESEERAALQAHWTCPACAEAWTEGEKIEAAKSAKLLHSGQEITNDGLITGEPPATQTLGFRWSAIDNPFVTAADLGADEWLARGSKDRENAERKMRQFIWTIPYEPPEFAITPLDPDAVQERTTDLKRGELPPDCIGISVGVDTGKRKLHWAAMAVVKNGSMNVIEHGIQPVDSDKFGVYRGLVESLKQLSSYFELGWSGRKPSQIWIDSGWHEHTDAVYLICEQLNVGLQPGAERYRPSKGYGEGQSRMGRYYLPTDGTRDTVYIGKEFYISRVRRQKKALPGVLLVHINSDHWKSEFHQRLAMPKDEQGKYEPGAITLYQAADHFEHSEFVNQATAEQQIEKQASGRGTVIVWERKHNRRDNHFLDAGYQATAAGYFIYEQSLKAPKVERPRKTLAQLAGRA
jgi:phage terminase large subunit GpA-like protein